MSSIGQLAMLNSNVVFGKFNLSGKNCVYSITVCGAFLHQAFPICLLVVKAMYLNLLVLVA